MRVALAWGCGTGSLLALDALVREGHDVTLLHLSSGADPLGSGRTVPDFLVEAQAAALGLPLVVAPVAEGSDELAALAGALRGLDVARVALGYVRGEEHAGWKVGKATRAAGVEPMLPVRHLPPGEAAREFASRGHRAFVRSVSEASPLGPAILGRFLDADFADEVDAVTGRAGWADLRFFAIDGPRFRRRVDATQGDARQAQAGWRLELGLRGC